MKRPLHRELEKHLRYVPRDGSFWWLLPRRGRKLNREAGAVSPEGYRLICFNGVLYKGHHLAWFLKTKRWPENEVDHRDGKPANNRWRNLREATSLQQKHNRRCNKTNACGMKGVAWKPDHKAWYARIRLGGKSKFLGYFTTARRAHLAYATAAKKHFGEFARV